MVFYFGSTIYVIEFVMVKNFKDEIFMQSKLKLSKLHPQLANNQGRY